MRPARSSPRSCPTGWVTRSATGNTCLSSEQDPPRPRAMPPHAVPTLASGPRGKLLTAATERNFSAIERLLNSNKTKNIIQAKDPETKKTALLCALDDSGGDSDEDCDNGQSNRMKIVKLLLDKGVNIDAVDAVGENALMYAAQLHRVDIVQLLIERGAKLDVRDIYGLNVLLHAAWNGCEKIIEVLLDQGVQVNSCDNDGMTALHHINFSNDFVDNECMNLLLERGADVNAVDKNKLTPLLRFAAEGMAGSVKILLEHGADVAARDGTGRTALMLAIDDLETVNELLARGAQVDATDKDGNTALHHAAKAGRAEVVAALMAAGVPAEHKNKKGETALSQAMAEKHAAVVEVIITNASEAYFKTIQPFLDALESST